HVFIVGKRSPTRAAARDDSSRDLRSARMDSAHTFTRKARYQTVLERGAAGFWPGDRIYPGANAGGDGGNVLSRSRDNRGVVRDRLCLPQKITEGTRLGMVRVGMLRAPPSRCRLVMFMGAVSVRRMT